MLALAFLAGVVHEDDLLDELLRGHPDDAVDGPEQRGPRLVVEHDHDAGGGELRGVRLALAPTNAKYKY